MREETVRETIKKLLTLSEGTNFEAEAQAALLKARELMAKYKIDNVNERKSTIVRRKILKDIVFGAKTDMWIADLVDIICTAHGCKGAGIRFTKFSSNPVLYGFEDDLEICEEMIRFAISSIDYNYNNLKSLLHKRATAKQLSTLRFSYGYGFANGLREQYDKQDAEEGWGLVLTTPDAVREATKDFKTRNVKTSKRINPNAYGKGFEDGRSFTTHEKIASKTA